MTKTEKFGTVAQNKILTRNGWKNLYWFNLQSSEMKKYLMNEGAKPGKVRAPEWIGANTMIHRTSSAVMKPLAFRKGRKGIKRRS